MDEEKLSNSDLIQQIKQDVVVESGQKRVTGGYKKRLGVGIFVILLGLAFGINWAYRTFGYYQVSDQTIHWHAHLRIVNNGVGVVIPPSVGLTSDIAHPANLHTHSDDGIIHMEIKGPVLARQVMLTRFFEVWEPAVGLTRKELGEPSVMTVNGVRNADLLRYVMRDGDEIELIY